MKVYATLKGAIKKYVGNYKKKLGNHEHIWNWLKLPIRLGSAGDRGWQRKVSNRSPGLNKT